MCGGRSLPDFFQKLRILFDIFLKYNIAIKLTKSYLNYPDIDLLGQQVNSLGLTNSDEKLKVMRLLRYPKTLGVLKFYLGLTRYLRSYIHFYAQLALPIQALKTSLLKKALRAANSTKPTSQKQGLKPFLRKNWLFSTPCKRLSAILRH